MDLLWKRVRVKEKEEEEEGKGRENIEKIYIKNYNEI